jgi:PAS domain S-box-containing protein
VGTHGRTPGSSGRRGAWREVALTAAFALAVFGLGAFLGTWQAVYDAAGHRFESRFGDIIVSITIAGGSFAFFTVRRSRQLRRESRLRAVSDERYRAVVERVPAITYSWDPSKPAGEAPALFVSPQLERILGYRPEDWMSDPQAWIRVIHPDDRDRVVRGSDTADRDGAAFVAEYRVIARDGRVVWIHDESAIVERDDRGRPAVAQGVMIDITRRKQTEQLLQETENRYRTLVERVPAVSYVWDSSHEQGTAPATYLSPQVEDLLGYSPDRMLDEPALWTDRIDLEDREAVLRAWDTAVSRGEPFAMEYRFVHADGRTIWLRDEAIPVSRDDAGVPLYQGVVIDITRQKLAESELRSSEAELRRLVEQLPVVSYLADGPDIRYVAPGIEPLTGLSPTGWTAPGAWERMIHPEDRGRVMAESDRVDVTRERFDIEYRIVRTDGEIVWVHDTAVHSDLGGDAVWLGVMEDVTERRRAEDDRRAAEARYRLLVEQLPAVVYVDAVDDVSTARYISPQYEQLTGYTPQERLADPGLWIRMLHPEDRDRVLERSRASNESGEDFDCEYRLIGKHGREVWVRDHAVLIEGEDGVPDVWQGVLSDVTDGRRATDALARRDQILQAVGYAAERFLNTDHWSDPIQDVLARIGGAAETSRAYVFENQRGAAGELLFIRRAEWVSDPNLATVADPELQRFAVRSNGYGRWERILGTGDVVHGAVRTFPPEERPNLMRQSIRSLCAVPVFVAGGWWGLIGVDRCDEERDWAPAEVDALRVAANTLGAAIGRERTERRLSETESRYRTFVEQIPAITYIEDASTGRAIYMSPQLQTILGYTREELDRETYWASLHPEDRERVRAEDERTNRTGEPYRVEYRERAKDGHWVWLRDEAVLVRDERDNPLYWQGVRFDISAEKEVEQQLRDTERRYRILVEQMPAITYIEGPPGSEDTVYISPQVEEFFGYTAEEWLRRGRWRERLHPEDLDRVEDAYRRADGSGEPFREEYRILHRNGHPVWVRDESVLIHDDAGVPAFRQGVYYDVTSRKETEQQLRRTEERFRTLVEQLPAITYIDEFDPDAEIWPTVYMSPQVEQILGYSADEWRRDPNLWLTILHPDDRERAVAADRRHHETGEPLIQEIRLLARDGDVHWMRDEAIVIRDENGDPRWSQGILIDVTERRQAEQALHEAEERYRGLVESIPAAIYIDTVEELSKAIYMSPQVEQIFGYGPDEWRDQPHLWESGLHPEDRDAVVEQVHRLNTSGETFEAEYRFFNPRRGWVWVHDQAVMIRDAEGGALFTQGVMFDITERKVSEDQLRDAEERFRGIVEHVPAAIYLDLPDDSFQTVYASPQLEQITGISPEEWCSNNDIWKERVHPEDREWVIEGYLDAVASGRPWSAEYRFVRPDGAEVWVHDETTLLHDESGEPRFLQGVMFDVTERRLAEQALRESERREREAAERLRALDEMKNTFLAAVSHELRSPLTSILGLALTLERQSDGLRDEDRVDMLERLASNARKLDRLLKDLLDIDRLNRGIVSPRYRVTDVGALARRTVASLEAVADRILDMEVESVVLPVDPAKVERIVENLVVNAIRHTLPTDRIWVRVEPAEGGVVIAVEDDGPGVSPDLREEIFEPFRQGPTASKSSPGTGIGLSLVARFAELHGGRAWVQERDGGGASFRVYLPSGRVDTDGETDPSTPPEPRLEIDASR